MALPELIILDVGHGNCAIVKSGDRAVIIDAPARPVVSEALDALKIARVEALLVSHADVDHVSGAIALLANRARPVDAIWINPDASKKTTAWRDFRIAVQDAKHRTNCFPSLTTTTPGFLRYFEVEFQILYPFPSLALGGAGSEDIDGRRLTSNSMSAVIRLVHERSPICLLAGDMDATTLANLRNERADFAASILVFPHHGGRPGNTDARTFARELTERVDPAHVVISMGRNRHENPQPEIVDGIQGDVTRYVRIACTQLSKRCASAPPGHGSTHLMNLASDGRPRNSACAGSIRIPLRGAQTQEVLVQLLEPHRKFVAKAVPGRLCRLRSEKT